MPAQDSKIPPASGYKRIATEEAFAPPEMMKMYRDVLANQRAALIAERCSHSCTIGTRTFLKSLFFPRVFMGASCVLHDKERSNLLRVDLFPCVAAAYFTPHLKFRIQ